MRKYYFNTFMLLIKLFTFSVFTRVTVHPPKPPPVKRLPYTPFVLSAISTNLSNSAHETLKSSLKLYNFMFKI